MHARHSSSAIAASRFWNTGSVLQAARRLSPSKQLLAFAEATLDPTAACRTSVSKIWASGGDTREALRGFRRSIAALLSDKMEEALCTAMLH